MRRRPPLTLLDWLWAGLVLALLAWVGWAVVLHYAYPPCPELSRAVAQHC